MPEWPLGGPADHGDVPRLAAAVAILEAAPTRALVRPGFNLVPPPGRPDAHVEATWILKRDGRSLGQPGALREARDRAALYGAHPPGWDRSGTLYGRAPHRDRERSGQRPLAVLGSLALNLGVKTRPLPPLVREYRGTGPLL